LRKKERKRVALATLALAATLALPSTLP